MTEYSDEWLIARAEASKAYLASLPSSLRQNFVLASATLPVMPAPPIVREESPPTPPMDRSAKE